MRGVNVSRPVWFLRGHVKSKLYFQLALQTVAPSPTIDIFLLAFALLLQSALKLGHNPDFPT